MSLTSDIMQQMCPYKMGTRIRMISMKNDPSPIASGEMGTITNVKYEEYNRCYQISVDWDCGSRLMLCTPPDRFETVYE